MKSILLVGHRATGKTTICRGLRTFGFECLDLDEVIEKESNRTPEAWVRESEMKFRSMEIETIKRLVSETGTTPRVISVGAGCLSLPRSALVIWISRDGWAHTAAAQRARLRDDLSFEEEVAWMKANREPTWRARAHVKIDIPQGRAPHRVIDTVGTLIEWLLGVPTKNDVKKIWIVATGRTLDRAMVDVEHFGFEGIEVRDDLMSTPIEAKNILASVRTAGSGWISQHPQAVAYDIDVELVADVLARGDLDDLEPRQLLLSSHPGRVDPIDIERLIAAGRTIEAQRPEWASRLVFKYAPLISEFDQLGLASALIEPLRRSGLKTSFLPQGELSSFLRPIIASENATNYLPSRLKPTRIGGGEETITPFDFQDFLPFLIGDVTQYRALIGAHASWSQGDVWHRRRALQEGRTVGYLKVDVPHEAQLEACLNQLLDRGVEELSVTSPLKKFFAYDVTQLAANELRPYAQQLVNVPESRIAFANTLRYQDGRWSGIETDSVGMLAALHEIEATITPGPVAVIGRGDVSKAVRTAIDASEWTLGLHVGAREGWGEVTDRFALIVNASGTPQFHGAPKSDAWLDLHYVGTVACDDRLYFTGDRFFEAQAEAQWDWWSTT